MRRWKLLLGTVLSFTLVLPLVAAPPALAETAEAGEAAVDEPRVLVFSATAGFRHDSIPAGIAAVQALGDEHGFAVDATEDSGAFTEENLANYDAVVWLSTTGSVLNAAQQEAFQNYIEGGGGYAGIHAASDTHYDWEWYGGLVGAYFRRHPPGTQTADIWVTDRAHPSTQHLDATWTRHDEWYDFDHNPRGNVHVLATLDERSYEDQVANAGDMGHDHPIAWCQIYNGGRSWYTGGGHTIASFSEDAFLEHMAGGIMWAAGMVAGDCGGTVWDNYEKVVLDNNTASPMALEVADDGRVFYIERNGQVRVIDPDTTTTSTVGTIPVYTGQENGLLGIALDPEFNDNDRIYFFYSPPNAVVGDNPRQHVSRFTLTEAGTLDLGSEEVLLEIPHQRQECCHSAGYIQFGPEGDLWISVGDDTNPFQSNNYAPIDERPGREPFDAQRSSANTNDLRGKLLRITPTEDGGYTIPEGNMFAPGTELTRPEIYAMGFRNPFRFSVDERTGVVYLADYGPDAGQPNPNRGPQNTVTWHIVDEPANHGWPYCIGNNVPYIDYDFATGESGEPFDCEGGPINDSPNNTGLEQLPPVKPAAVWYHYSPPAEFPMLGGGAPMGGPRYYFDAELESETQWPASFDGTVMFYEWGANQLFEFNLNDDVSGVTQIARILPDMQFLRPMDMEFGPHDGAMYLIEWGSGFGGNNPDSQVVRIDYTGGQFSPIARASATPTSGDVPLTVEFSSAGSLHPQGLEISYAWDFGDGTTSDEQNPTHTYTEPGNYTAVLTVTDPEGRTGTANVSISAGNTEPEVTIDWPVHGGVFEFGDTIPFEVSVVDAEDGSTEDGGIDCDDVTVEVIMGHDDHGHPMQQYTGCEGSFDTPVESGHSAVDNLFYVVEASYTDRGAHDGAVAPLTGRALHVLQPKRKQAQHWTSMSGVQTESTSDPEGGGQNVGWIDDGDWISYSPFNFANIDGIRFRVASNTSGGVIEIRADAPDGQLLGQVAVPGTGGWQNWTWVETDVDNPGGTFDLYLVFPDGGFNINFFDFQGTGVADATAPQVTASATPTSGEAPLDVEFTGSATSPADREIVSYTWEFGDGATAEGPDASHTYTEPGTYSARLTATDAEGAIGRASVAIQVTAPPPPPSGDLVCLGTRSDDFSGDSLDRDRWTTIVRENPDGYSVGDGALTLQTLPGDIYGADNTAENLVFQPAPDGPFEISAKITAPIANQWQQAGIMVYGDDDNYVKLNKLGTQSGTTGRTRKFEFIWENNASPRNSGGQDDSPNLPADFPDTYYVKIISDGENLTGQYSADGSDWVDVGRPAPLADIGDNPMVGMHALKGSTPAPVIDAEFDWFRVTPDDTAERPAPSDEFEGDVLDGCRWDRVVRYDPTKLRVIDGQLLIDTPDGDIYGGGNATPENFILQTQPDGDWTVETRLHEELVTDYQQAGLMVYVDDDNYVKFDVIADQNQTGTNRIELRSEIDGDVQQPQPNLDAPPNDGTWYLRLAKEGNSFSGQVSTNGHTWTDMPASVSNPGVAANGGVGLFTLGVNQAEPTTVAFDYFRVEGDDVEPPECVVRSDDFSGDELDRDRWSRIVREDPETLRVEDGALIIPTTNTDIYGTGNNNTPNIVLQPLPSGAWQATAHLTLEARDAYQQAGLIVYGDDNNYAKMVLQARSTSGPSQANRIFQFIREENGNPNEVGDSNTGQLGADYPDTVWVRFVSDGTNLNAYYSADGETFTAMPQTKAMAGMNNPHIGLFSVSGAGTRPVIDAHFHEFVFEADDECPPDVDPVEPPTVSVEFSPAEADGDNGWYVSPVDLTLTSDDAGATLEWRLAGDDEWTTWTQAVTLDEDGVYELQFRATNEAGSSDVGQATVSLDQTAPSTEAQLAGEQDGDVYTGAVTVTLEASDETSGVAETRWRMAGDDGSSAYDEPIVVTGDGEHTVEFRSVDVAGNVEDWQSVTFTITTPEPEPECDGRIVIGSQDSGVADRAVGDRCLSDHIDQDGPWRNRGLFVAHVSQVTEELVEDGDLSERERADLVRAAAQSGIGRPPRGR